MELGAEIDAQIIRGLKDKKRLFEDETSFGLDPDGDDNPDIEDYMGNFEFSLVYKLHNLELRFNGRQNFQTQYGSAEFGLTFPLWGKPKGYTTVFDGNGESLIYYNYSQTSFGVGISLSNIL